jgi:ribosomal protein L37E
MAKDEDQSQRTVVCKSCGKAIVIATLTKQVAEFSVKCNHCGKRSFYLPDEIRK